MYDSVIIGCGFAGGVMANRLASDGKKVLLIEKRNHIGGNAYDTLDEHGVLIHQYGPHIFHTNNLRVFEFLSEFTDWQDYHHEVLAYVDGKYLPIPFNLNTLNIVNKEKAEEIKTKLLQSYDYGSKVPILELKNNKDKDIREIADFVYNNIFLHYTMKQWGKTPGEIDPNVTARVPVIISEDNGYFQDIYQGMPTNGYTEIFNKMLNHPNIDLRLGTDANEFLTFNANELIFEGEIFNGDLIYTGAIDELFNYKYGKLPYRTLEFKFEHYHKNEFQPSAVVNYTVSEEFTRITEFKKLTGQIVEGTTIVKEYPKEYTNCENEIPYYAINNKENDELYSKYENLVKNYKSFYLLGRLAEYKYYNMDSIVERALNLSDTLTKH